jgi:hypothetical protein
MFENKQPGKIYECNKIDVSGQFMVLYSEEFKALQTRNLRHYIKRNLRF